MRARSRSSSVSAHVAFPFAHTAHSAHMALSALSACIAFIAFIALPGCTLEPAGTGEQFRRLADAGESGGAWQAPPAERQLPDLPAEPSADDVVTRALLCNGELEAAWHAWRAALERVLVASGWPNTDFSIGLTKFLEHGSAWDTSAVTFGFDPMQMLLLPDKVRTAGEVAFREALGAGRRFEAARVALRERVLLAWWDWTLLGEQVAIQEQRVALVASLQGSASAALMVGGPQRDVARRQVEAGMALVELDELLAMVPGQRAALNALLARAPDAPLAWPTPGAPWSGRPEDELPLPTDEAILATGMAANPELAELVAMAEAREQALDLADMRHEPNLAPSFTASGGSSESVGLMLTLPTTVPAVQAAVRAARADLDEAQARLRQADFDTRAALLAMLATLRNDEHRLVRLRDEIVPAARALLDNARAGYATGLDDLAAYVEARSAVLDVDLALAEARAARARHLASLERITGTELRNTPRADDATQPLAAGDRP